MYVCLCEGITESDIREALLKGDIETLDALEAALGVASQCGQCAECATEVLNSLLKELKSACVQSAS